MNLGDMVTVTGSYRTGERGEVVEILDPSPSGAPRVAVKLWDLRELRRFTVDFSTSELTQ